MPCETAFPIRARNACETIAVAAVAGQDAEPLLRRVAVALRRAVPHDAGGWSTTDPGTLMWTGGVMYGLPPEVAAGFYDNELLQDDCLKFTQLTQARRPVGVLSAATGGELERSARYRTMYAPHGIGDELRVAVMADGVCFATACLLRAAGAPAFSAQEVELVERVSRHVAQGLRAAVVRPPADGVAGDGGDPGCAPGVLVLDDELRPLSATDQAHAWLEQLGHSLDGDGLLPVPVVSVARRARALLDGGGADGPPLARLRTRGGGWLRVHASLLTPAPRTWAVVLEPARPAEVLPLLAQACELTAREREVFGLLLRGVPDKLIARRLTISDHTAREHARNVQRKLGVRSRGELQALLHDDGRPPTFAPV